MFSLFLFVYLCTWWLIMQRRLPAWRHYSNDVIALTAQAAMLAYCSALSLQQSSPSFVPPFSVYLHLTGHCCHGRSELCANGTIVISCFSTYIMFLMDSGQFEGGGCWFQIRCMPDCKCWVYFMVRKSKMALDLQRNTHAKFRANMCNSKRVMSDRWNLKWRPPPSWIYYFCPFWLNVLFPVAAVYITTKFHSSTSIGGWVIDVCAKIQDSGCRHLEL